MVNYGKLSTNKDHLEIAIGSKMLIDTIIHNLKSLGKECSDNPYQGDCHIPKKVLERDYTKKKLDYPFLV
jgi:hypothetical protein